MMWSTVDESMLLRTERANTQEWGRQLSKSAMMMKIVCKTCCYYIASHSLQHRTTSQGCASSCRYEYSSTRGCSHIL